jgi:hypothetical protein
MKYDVAMGTRTLMPLAEFEQLPMMTVCTNLMKES